MDLDELLGLGGRVGAGKTSSDSVSVNQSIREAQELDDFENTNTERKAKSRAERVARAKSEASTRKAEVDATQKKYGTADTSKVDAVEGKGPFNKNFDTLAAGDPLRATQELDTVESVLGLKGGAASADAPMYRGSHKASDGSGEDIPYFTNIPGAPEGVSNLERYQPGARQTEGLGGGVETDPRKREIAERIRDARDQVRLGPKTPDAIAGEVARNMKGAVADIQSLGNEAASEKWLARVASGDLSDAAYKRMHVEAADVANREDEAEYQKVRNGATDVARQEGVTTALQQLRENRLGAKGNPRHMKRIEAELQMRARPATHPDMLFTPDLYLPASRADAAQIRGANPGTVTDVNAPSTLINPHGQGGKSTEEIANTQADDTINQLIGVAQSPQATGTKARDAVSYTAGTSPGGQVGPTKQEKNKQSTRVGAGNLGYETGGSFLPENAPSTDDMLSWLEGGGDIDRGRKTRQRRKGK